MVRFSFRRFVSEALNVFGRPTRRFRLKAVPAVETLETRTLLAVTVELVNDISPAWLTNVNGTLYFRADDGLHGYELWKSNGTSTGTVLIKDIHPGGSSVPQLLTNVNGTLYFMANDGTNGYELWKSDGTSSGTVLVKDIRGGGGNSYPRYLKNLNGTLYFQANDGTNGHELWKSDGTSTGTVLVKDIRVGGGNSNPFDLTDMNGTLYFRAYDLINGVELWKSDGTSSGTVVVKDIRAGLSGSYPYSLTNVNGTLFFKADDGTNGQELWKTDGTSSGTVLVKNIRSRHYDSNLQYLTNVNGTLFFQANDGTNGRELWKSDGTSSGTVLVKDIMYVNSYPQFLTNLNGTLYFRANDGTNGRELWKSDGTSTGTVLVKNIQTGGKYSDSSPYGFIQINGTSYFRANDGIHGSELWKTDGTSTGTVLVKDLQAGVSGSHPNFFTDVNGTLYFSASSGTHSFALWRVIEEVSNSAPTNITLSASSVAENQPSGTAVGSFSTTDPDVGDTFTYALVAGDVADFQIVGSELRSNRAFDFETKSSYSVTVRTTDAGGRTFDKIFTISVADLLEISAGADLGAKEGDLVALGSGAYNGPVPTSLLTLQIDWGDGTIEPGVLVPVAGTNGGTIANSHRYVDEGSYTITLTLSDGTSTIVDSLIASVANAAPAVGSLSGPAAAVRGQLVAYRVLFTDAGIADTQTASIDWGDGTSTSGTVAQAAGAGTVNGSHIYTATGIYTVTVTVTDNDGGATSQTRNVTIASANLQVSELDPTKTDLFVGGTTSNDTIAVALSGTNTTVTINTVSVGSFAPTGRIVIFGQAGNDNVTVASTITRAAWLYGDDDNDTLTGGGGNDVLVGGTGADSQVGGAGNDTYTFDSDTPLGVDTVNDSVGTDTIDFTATTSQAIALNLGLITAQGVNANLTLTLTSASAIENVTGGSLADTLTGNALTNLLVGGPGNDTLIGAAGNDTYQFDLDETLGADTLNEDGGGLDTLDFSPTTGIGATVDLSLATVQTIATGRLTLVFGSATTFENIIGGANNDSLTGNTLANTLTGGPGSDSLDGSGNNDSLIGGVGDDTLTGGMGNDSYIYAANTALGSDTLVELAGEGTDLITFATTTTKGVVLNLGLTTTQTAVTGNLNVTLNAADTFENVIGGSLADRLTGNLLGNLLLGGPGNDTLAGAAGNDVYSYSTSIPLGTDTLVEVVGEGADMLDFSLTTTLAVVVNLNMATTQLVNANLSLVLGAVDTFENVSGGSLNDTLTGNALTNRLVGNAGLDTLVAGAGNDTLDGGLGNDNLQGGTDNDTYLLDADLVLGTDTLTELADGGTDTLDFSQTTGKALVFNLGSIAAQTVVASNLTLTLSSAETFENVIGGTLNDTVTGNALANRLDGNAGNDTLQGLAGDDMLIGGLGNDSFVFCTDFALGIDTLDESAGGLDTLDFATSSTLGVTVNLGTATTQMVNANLSLLLGADNTFENTWGGSLNDTLIGNALANTLLGNVGNDTLTGGAANDSLAGGLGDDTYLFAANSPLGTDTLNESAGGTDTLDFSGTTSTNVTLNLGTIASQVVNANLSLVLGLATAFEHSIGGGGNDLLTGNMLANVLSGGAGNDTLVGLPGNDTLLGGQGDDSYVFAANALIGTDRVVEYADEGFDLLDLSTSTVAVIVNLGLTTTQTVNANLSLTLNAADTFEMLIGSSVADTLTGNSLANVIFGGAGNDTIAGLAGRDLLFGGNGNDSLNGGDDEDLTIGGLTTYFSESTKLLDRTAIKAIWNEWTRTDLAYANRITNLKSGGGLNGTYKLSTLTVLTDTPTMFDTLIGGLALDWFWQFSGDVVSDLHTGGTETVN